MTINIMAKTKKIILLFVAFICLFGIIYSADFGVKPFIANIINPVFALVIGDTPDIDDPPSVSSDECQLFYVKKEDTNKCIETLKGSNVYESDPWGKKVESMIIIPGI